MTNTELQFREIETQLDRLLAKASPAFEENSISVKDTSVRSYHYKADHLWWSVRLERVWELSLDTAKVQVSISYYEPIHANEQANLTIAVRAEKFRQGQQSSIDDKTEHTVTLESAIHSGLDLLALQHLRKGAAALGQAL